MSKLEGPWGRSQPGSLCTDGSQACKSETSFKQSDSLGSPGLDCGFKPSELHPASVANSGRVGLEGPETFSPEPTPLQIQLRPQVVPESTPGARLGFLFVCLLLAL